MAKIKISYKQLKSLGYGAGVSAGLAGAVGIPIGLNSLRSLLKDPISKQAQLESDLETAKQLFQQQGNTF